MELQHDILTALRIQEATLQSALEAVRQAILAFEGQSPTPTVPRPKRNPPEPADRLARLMNRILAELGPQFTSVDFFDQAKKLRPGLKRAVLQKEVNRLLRDGVISKIEAGRGWRPSRYQKRFV